MYRGDEIPALRGTYIYGDVCSGSVLGLPYYTSVGDPASTGVTAAHYGRYSVISFGQDNQGELYITTYYGRILKLVAKDGAAGVQSNPNVPEKLSDSLCVDPNNPSEANEAMIPYSINAEHWTDEAHYKNWMSVPNDKQIDHQNA